MEFTKRLHGMGRHYCLSTRHGKTRNNPVTLPVAILTATAFMTSAVYAQLDSRFLGISASESITINASDSVEWLQDKQQYVARGNVQVQKGASLIKADTLQADYVMEKNKPRVKALQATGNVLIKDKTATARGQQADYNTASGLFTLKGKTVTLDNPDFSLIAGEKVEFLLSQKKAIATGGATVIRKADNSRLASRTLTLFFTEDKKGNLTLQRVLATGKVQINAQGRSASSESGDYDATTGNVNLKDNVTLQQGTSQIKGSGAAINLQQGTSTLTNEKGRVEGVLGKELFEKKK